MSDKIKRGLLAGLTLVALLASVLGVCVCFSEISSFAKHSPALRTIGGIFCGMCLAVTSLILCRLLIHRPPDDAPHS